MLISNKIGQFVKEKSHLKLVFLQKSWFSLKTQFHENANCYTVIAKTKVWVLTCSFRKYILLWVYRQWFVRYVQLKTGFWAAELTFHITLRMFLYIVLEIQQVLNINNVSFGYTHNLYEGRQDFCVTLQKFMT